MLPAVGRSVAAHVVTLRTSCSVQLRAANVPNEWLPHSCSCVGGLAIDLFVGC